MATSPGPSALFFRAALVFLSAGVMLAATASPASALPPGTLEPATVSAVAPPDALSAANYATAAAIARRFAHPVIVESSLTPTTTVKALPDGTSQLETTTVPVRVKSSDGWVSVDLSLQQNADGRLTPKAATVPVEFSAGGAGPLARVQTSTGKWLEEQSPFGMLPKPTVSGAGVTYAKVLPGVDLKLTATSLGMSEVLVIKDAAAAADPLLSLLKLQLDGAVLKKTSGGATQATVDDGSQLEAGSPTWWDSADGSDANGPVGNQVGAPVTETTTASSVALKIADALSTRKVTYPVYIDPDWTGGSNHYWYVDQAYPTTSYLDGANAGGQERVGYITAAYSPDSRNHLARTFFQLDTSAVAGKIVTSAQLSTTETWAFNCTASPVDLWWVADVPPGTTWNNTGNPWLQKLDTQNVAKRSDGSGACAQGAVGFNATAAAQQAAAQLAGHLDLGLRAQNEANNSGWKRFDLTATLTITYDSTPNTPASPSYASPVRACATSSSSPTGIDGTQPMVLQASASDPDVGQNLATTFTVRDAQSGATVISQSTAYQASGTSQTTIAANALNPGTYAWSASTSDGSAQSASSGNCYFVLINAGPAIPGVGTEYTGQPMPSVGKPINLELTSAAVDGVAIYAYWWAVGNSTSSPPQPPALTPIVPGASLPACGSASGPVRFVCPGNSSSVPSTDSVVTVAPIDDISTLWVASYNAAGRVSADSSGHYTAAHIGATVSSDTTGISLNVGHIWDQTLIDPEDWGYEPAPDLNTNFYGTATTSSDGLYGNTPSAMSDVLGPPSTEVFSFPGYMLLNQWEGWNATTSQLDPSKFSTESGDETPAGSYHRVTSLGGIVAVADAQTAQPTGTSRIYSCATAMGEMTSMDAACESTGAAGTLLGYTYDTQSDVPTFWRSLAQQLHRCVNGTHGDYFDATDCGTQTVSTDLGWIVRTWQSQGVISGHSDVDTSQSFTVSAWVNPDANVQRGVPYTIASQGGTSLAGFTLGINTAGGTSFCYQSQTNLAVRDCATDNDPLTTGQWSYVTGVWDASNEQLRLLLGSDITPVAVASHSATGETASTGVFCAASTCDSPQFYSNQWKGLLDHPSIFPGVIGSDQLSNLYNQLPPQ